MLKIVTAPNPILSQSAKQISKIDSKILNLIADMKKTLLSAKDPKGVGLAAPQIGISFSIFQIKPNENAEIKTFINPAVKEIYGEEAIPKFKNSKKIEAKKPKSSRNRLLEGCLSLPNIWGEVKRKPAITISFLDEKGKEYLRKFTGFTAIIIQHEMDHLNGILFPKRVLEQKGTLYKSHEDEKGEDVFEEIEI